jgi:hypothetical protein
MRRWLFGSDAFAYPWLRWLSVPLFRIGVLLTFVPLAVTGHETWVSSLGIVCLAISIAAEVYDRIERRRRRRVSVRVR